MEEEGKGHENFEFEPKEKLDPSKGASYSNKDKKNRFEKTKCTY